MEENTNGHSPRTCGDCYHGYFGSDGLFCMTFKELIPDERVAMECVSFDEVPAGVDAAIRRMGRNDLIREALSTVVPVQELDNLELDKGLELDEVLAAPSSELIEACDSFLEARNCVLWGMPFEIISPRGRKEAAEWLAAQITGVGYVATVHQ